MPHISSHDIYDDSPGLGNYFGKPNSQSAQRHGPAELAEFSSTISPFASGPPATATPPPIQGTGGNNADIPANRGNYIYDYTPLDLPSMSSGKYNIAPYSPLDVDPYQKQVYNPVDPYQASDLDIKPSEAFNAQRDIADADLREKIRASQASRGGFLSGAAIETEADQIRRLRADYDAKAYDYGFQEAIENRGEKRFGYGANTDERRFKTGIDIDEGRYAHQSGLTLAGIEDTRRKEREDRGYGRDTDRYNTTLSQIFAQDANKKYFHGRDYNQRLAVVNIGAGHTGSMGNIATSAGASLGSIYGNAGNSMANSAYTGGQATSNMYANMNNQFQSGLGQWLQSQNNNNAGNSGGSTQYPDLYAKPKQKSTLEQYYR